MKLAVALMTFYGVSAFSGSPVKSTTNLAAKAPQIVVKNLSPTGASGCTVNGKDITDECCSKCQVPTPGVMVFGGGQEADKTACMVKCVTVGAKAAGAKAAGAKAAASADKAPKIVVKKEGPTGASGCTVNGKDITDECCSKCRVANPEFMVIGGDQPEADKTACMVKCVTP